MTIAVDWDVKPQTNQPIIQFVLVAAVSCNLVNTELSSTVAYIYLVTTELSSIVAYIFSQY